MVRIVIKNSEDLIFAKDMYKCSQCPCFERFDGFECGTCGILRKLLGENDARVTNENDLPDDCPLKGK